MCEFQSFLYFGDDGYVVKCKHCGHYQVGFAGVMLTLTDHELKNIGDIVKKKCCEENYAFSENAKCIIIPTTSKVVSLLLTHREVIQLSEILDEADTEAKALSLINLFNP